METTLTGQVRKIIFRNEENGYVVATLARDSGGLVTIVGTLPALASGETIRITGQFQNDPRHGSQFRVTSYENYQPEDAEAIARYLGSGLIKGLGLTHAKAIVDKFGDKTFDIIERSPKRLREVPGIGKVRAAGIKDAWQTMRHLREIGMLLQQVSAPRSLAPKIVQALGGAAYDVIHNDPYRLVGLVRGIGFHTADLLAGRVGIARDDPRRLRAGLLQGVEEAVEDGNTVIPAVETLARAAKLLDIAEETIDPHIEGLLAEGRLVRFELKGETHLAPPVLAAAERRLAKVLTAIHRAPSRFRKIDEAKARTWVEKRLGLQLADNQISAIGTAVHHSLSVITGGPGTGKTTIVRAICEIGEALDRRIVLCAPTGRAAKRLSEATGRTAKTVHRLLEINPQMKRFDRNAQQPLEADMIVCDEASMLDVYLALALAEATPEGAHLVLVGDVDQLPSVGPGAVLADLLACPWAAKECLNEIFRQAADSRIVTNAHRIRNGELPELTAAKNSDFFFLEEDDSEKLHELVVDLAARRLPAAYGFDPLTDIMVLAPMHRGDVGVARLNDALRTRLNPQGQELKVGDRIYRLGDKVMQTANNYDLDIYNGDLGRIVRMVPEARQITVDFDGRAVTVESEQLDDLTAAYAISIHKSQGSEYPCVVAPLHTQHFIMLARNLLYTAVTRGKRLVVVCGSRRALERAVANDTAMQRRTMLGRLLGT